MAKKQDGMKKWYCRGCGNKHAVDVEFCPDCYPNPKATPPERLAYISGPMRGFPNDNYDAFNALEIVLREQGWNVLNPTRHFDGDHTREWQAYMELDIQDVVACGAIFMLRGWQDSEGARLERQIAIALGKAIHYVDGAKGEEPVELVAADITRSGARQSSYGHPAQDFERTAKVWSAVLGGPVSPLQVALCMAGLKISRLSGNPDHRDSLVDLIGYAIAYERVQDWYKEGNI